MVVTPIQRSSSKTFYRFLKLWCARDKKSLRCFAWKFALYVLRLISWVSFFFINTFTLSHFLFFWGGAVRITAIINALKSLAHTRVSYFLIVIHYPLSFPCPVSRCRILLSLFLYLPYMRILGAPQISQKIPSATVQNKPQVTPVWTRKLYSCRHFPFPTVNILQYISFSYTKQYTINTLVHYLSHTTWCFSECNEEYPFTSALSLDNVSSDALEAEGGGHPLLTGVAFSMRLCASSEKTGTRISWFYVNKTDCCYRWILTAARRWRWVHLAVNRLLAFVDCCFFCDWLTW